MVVTADTVQSTEYDDYDVQTVVVEMQPQQDIGAGSTVHDNVFSFEPLGGLARDEIAELVALTESTSTHPRVTDVEDPAETHTRWEVSFDSRSQLVDGSQSNVERLEDLDGVLGADVLVGQKVDVDILRRFSLGACSSHSDDTAGEGGPGAASNDFEIIPYRQVYGSGPTVDRHDEIYYHVRQRTNGSGAAQIGVEHTYVWDVKQQP